MSRGCRAGAIRSAGAVVAAALLVLLSPGPALAAFSIDDFTATPNTADAGSHPDSTVTMDFGGDVTDDVKDIIQHFPGGIIPNPEALPKCEQATFLLGACPPDTQLGTTTLTATLDDGTPLPIPPGQVYNLKVSPPWAGGLGFVVAGSPLAAPFTVRSARFGAVPDFTGASPGLPDPPGLTTSLPDAKADIFTPPIVPTARDYGLTGLSINVPRMLDLDGPGPAPPVDIKIEQISYTLCGIRWDPIGGACSTTPSAAGPYLTTTTACVQGYARLEATSWDDPTRKVQSPPPGYTLTGTNCDGVPFAPDPFDVALDNTRTDTPSGYDISVNVPANEVPRHQSYSKRAAITLPPGTALSPAAADGLQGCTDAELGFGTQLPPACPAGSDIGDVTVKSKNVPADLHGNFYLGEPTPGHTYRVFIAFQIVNGLWIKLDGESFPDPNTGQVTTVFDDLPMLPFEKFTISLEGGAHAVLVNPPDCGAHTLTSTLTPWSGATSFPADKDEHPEGQFNTSYDGAGAACPDPFPFDPAIAGSTNPLQAGALSSLALTVSSPDRDQLLKTLRASLPPGLLGSLAAVPLCSLADAAAGSCAEASKIGSVDTSVGSGPSPLSLPGSIYLAQPLQAGDPASLSIVVPARAGPFDFGKVVTRAQVVLRSDFGLDIALYDDLPPIIGGIPIRVRDVSTAVDKANFTHNPTSCAQLQFGATFTSRTGTEKTATAPYQATGCNTLPFSPKLRFVASGQLRKNGNPALRAIVTQPSGQANIAKSVVVLPDALRPDVPALQRPGALCPESLAATRACPASSKVGVAKATTPLLPEPLSGPVYLVQFTGTPLPKLLIFLDGRVSVRLEARNELQDLRIVNRFDSLPDVPITRFELSINGGRDGILENHADLCASVARGKVTFTAHSGKTFSDRPAIEAPACNPNASIALRGVRSGKPSLKVRVRRALGAAKLRELTLKLPKGLRVHRGDPRRGVHVRASLKPRRGRWSLTRKGVLKVRLSRGAASVTAFLGNGVLRSSPGLRKRSRGKRRPVITFVVRLKDVRGHRFTFERKIRARG